MSEQDKNVIYETVAWYNPDSNLSRKCLIHFIRLTQSVLRYKTDQLESLTNEFDEIAIKQGKEEGSKLQVYEDEIERLQEELDYYKRADTQNVRLPSNSDDDDHRELLKLQLQNEELLQELNEKEKDLVLEKKEVERYASQVVTLEREKHELNRELKALQDDGTQKHTQSLKGSPEPGAEKQNTLTEAIRQKNKHISHLLEDIEMLEEENATLRGKISAIKDELTETTTHIKEITTELSKLKHLNTEYEKNEIDLKERINGLTCQIEELVEEKAKYDKQMDEYVLMFNKKMEEWKNVLDNKDDEINRLTEDIKKFYSSSHLLPNADVGSVKLNKQLLQQQQQINILQEELQRATEEINNSSELIERLKQKQMTLTCSPMPILPSTNFMEEKINVLEEKLVYAENDALAKAEEMSNLIIQLREYESSVFGLSDAVIKIKKLEKDILQKDLQAEKLVEICNNLEIKLDYLEEQNVALREKLGLTVSEEVDTSGVSLRIKKDEELMKNLKYKLDRKEEELIKAKLKNRKIVTMLKMLPTDGAESVSNTVQLEESKQESNKHVCLEQTEKLKFIIKENDALRKGMHEILESIREQDGCGLVEVQSSCLERLLAALDSRHVSGWYHPAMRLQVQLSTEEGKNDELRNQIRSLRAEERKKASELQNAYLKIQSLENDLSTPRIEEKRVDMPAETSDSPKFEPLKSQVVSNFQQEQQILKLESRLFQLKLAADSKAADFDRRERSFDAETEQLKTKIEELESQVGLLKSQNISSEFEEMAKLSSNLLVLQRKVKYLENVECENRDRQDKLRQELIDQEGEMLQYILQLQKGKSELLYKIEHLEETILRSVPHEQYVSVVNELESLTAKYKETICLSVTREETSCAQDFQTRMDLLQEENRSLYESLKTTREKLIVTEAQLKEEAVTNGDFVNELSKLASTLAASEVTELNAKQKSSHLEKMNNALRTQQLEMESRIKELLDSVEKLTGENLKYQEVERVLRMESLGYLAQEDRAELEEKVKTLGKRLREVTLERDNVQELFEISQGQCRALQEWKNEDRMLLSSQAEQILLLQADGDDKATLSRLSHELTMSRLLSSELAKKNNDLKLKMGKTVSDNLTLETKISEYYCELHKTKRKYLKHVGQLYQVIRDVRKLYGCAVPFHNIEDICKIKVLLREKEKSLTVEMENLKKEKQEYLFKKDEMETQLESLDDLKSAIKGETKNLVLWHNRTTELRIKEMKYRRQNEFLRTEVTQLQNCIRKLNDELTASEQYNLEKEKEWEQKQVLWEESQLEMYQLLQEKGIKQGMKAMCDATTNTTIVNEGPEKPEEEKRSLQEPVSELTDDYEEEVEAMEGDRRLNKFDVHCVGKTEQAEKEALKMTVESLQNVIKQKEETILRYQDLLKESREEYGKSYAKLQEELKNLNEAMAGQRKEYNKLKYAMKANHYAGENITTVVEKYMTNIQELEEELRECQLNLCNVNTQVYVAQQEMEKWKNLASERLLQMEDIKRRVEEECRSEIETYRKQVKNYEAEVERLTKVADFQRSASDSRNSIERSEKFQMKLFDHEEKPTKSERFLDCSFEKQQSQKYEQLLREVETLRKQLKLAKDDSSRLGDQVRFLQAKCPKKSVRVSGSLTTRSDSKSSVREGSLTSKIKNLEELLTTSKEREKELIELNEKKVKSAEEVARWDERKKNQQLIKNLTTKLKEKEAEVEVLMNKNESFRNMVYKCERDKSILESQLKIVKGDARVNTRIEKLTEEKKDLEKQLTLLQEKLEEQQRHSHGIGAALLHEKLEAQERKLVAFELTSKGQSVLMEELETLRTVNGNLEKSTLKLEGENLALQLKLEKEKAETKYLADKVRNLHDELKCCNSEKTTSHLKTIEKLMEENKLLRKGYKTTTVIAEMDKVKKTLANLREHHKLLREKYADLMERNRELEEELRSFRYQISLMEVDSPQIMPSDKLSPNVQATTDLPQELAQLRAKLAHKNHLLSRVKLLLVKAAAKEKAMQKEVNFIQCSIPKESSDV
ncbi:hypothetical protein RUM44_005419 [Polyplax serrata]|uniref:Centrosomal protein of 290 kDa n=1 Tax=Polyplax serrata TaxID=468196 RepID=A0ABR1ADH3_POLSC